MFDQHHKDVMISRLDKQQESHTSRITTSKCYGLVFYYIDGNDSIQIMYDEPIIYNLDGEISGFYYCQRRYKECDEKKDVREWISLDFGNIHIINDTVLRIKSLKFQYMNVSYTQENLNSS